MTGSKQAIALGRVIVFGGCLGLSATAAAYGQQWRPASMPPAFGHSGTPGRIANSPSFRPRAAVASKRFRRVADTRLAPDRYGVARIPTPPVRPLPALPRGYGYPPAARTTPPWGAPFATMARLWQPAMPAFQQPIYGHHGGDPRFDAGRGAQPAPRMLGYRPATPAHLPARGNWRPAPPIQAATRQVARDRVAHYAMRRLPVFRSNQVVASATRVDRPVSLSPTSVRAAQRSWRPAAGGRLVSSPPPSAFRPVAYGRPAGSSGRLASSMLPSTAARDSRRQLPGWVTTLHDSDSGDLCSWCSGS